MGDFNRNRSGGGDRGGRGGFGGGSGRPSFGGGRSGGRPSFGRGDDRGGRGGYEKPQMYKAICDDCGAPCELPFRPNGDKPVFCRDCFGKSGGGKGAPRGNDSYRDKREDSFREPRRESASVQAPGITKEQFEMLNNKLDKLLRIVTPVIEVSKEMQAQAVVKSEKSAEKKAAKTAKSEKPAKVEASAKVEAPVKAAKEKKIVKKAKK